MNIINKKKQSFNWISLKLLLNFFQINLQQLCVLFVANAW